MAIFEGALGSLLAAAVYDGLKSGGKVILGPYYKAFQEAEKKARKQLKKEFTEGQLLSIFTTFNNMEWKLSFGKKAREEVEKNLIKGAKAIDGEVFVDELVSELHQNNKQYNIELVRKVISRFMVITSQELRADHEILNYLQDMKLDTIIEKIDSSFEVIAKKQERLERRFDEFQRRIGEPTRYADGIPQSKNLNLRTIFAEGEKYLDEYQYEKAIKAFRAGLALKELQPSEAAALLINIGFAQYYQSKWDEAEGSLKEALDWGKRGKDEWGEANALGNLGVIYQYKGKWGKAIQFYDDSLNIKNKIGDKHGIASTYINLGNIYREKGKWKKAVECYRNGLIIGEKIRDLYIISQSLAGLGLVYYNLGELDKTIEFCNRTLKIKGLLGDNHGIATTFNNLAGVYALKGQWDEAKDFYEKSLGIYQKIGDEYWDVA